MNPKDQFPTDEDEILELAQKIIKDATDNPAASGLPVPVEELQRLVDEVVMARYAEAVAKKVEKQVTEEAQAAKKRLRVAEQSLQGQGSEGDTQGNEASLSASGKTELAKNVFAKLADRSGTLRIPKKDKD